MLAGLALWCYGTCVVVDPGSVPSGYDSDAAEAGTHLKEVKRKTGQRRTCAKCGGAPKPPRTHHCRVCGRCVLR